MVNKKQIHVERERESSTSNINQPTMYRNLRTYTYTYVVSITAAHFRVFSIGFFHIRRAVVSHQCSLKLDAPAATLVLRSPDQHLLIVSVVALDLWSQREKIQQPLLNIFCYC